MNSVTLVRIVLVFTIGVSDGMYLLIKKRTEIGYLISDPNRYFCICKIDTKALFLGKIKHILYKKGK